MIAKETTIHKRPNDTDINNYRSPYGLQQSANLMSTIKGPKNDNLKAIQMRKLTALFI